MSDRHVVLLRCMAGKHDGRECAVITTLDDDLSEEMVRVAYVDETTWVPQEDVTLYVTDGPNVTNPGLSNVH